MAAFWPAGPLPTTIRSYRMFRKSRWKERQADSVFARCVNGGYATLADGEIRGREAAASANFRLARGGPFIPLKQIDRETRSRAKRRAVQPKSSRRLSSVLIYSVFFVVGTLRVP